ncbi:hypothetical protein MLD38_015116 [Melastoma candidum]|uniref:Uncharacterized protein n=1 Tax=Melastoma candidum TaxID=119954 RepID=A0ACB9RF55_9MYRT|nr:hypothetical protein MLD38_015116 [Melastoma candidum]
MESCNATDIPNYYINSLVKHFASSSTTRNPKNTLPFGEEMNLNDNRCQPQRQQQTHVPRQVQQQQHNKLVGRRLHTSRPYQERLVNMAEARMEIVTALKFHRAAMKQRAEQQQQQRQPQDMSPQLAPPRFQHDFEEFPDFRSLNLSESHSSLTYQILLDHLNRPVSLITSLPTTDILNCVLPNQPLGLNLNLQDFDNINASLFHTFDTLSSLYSTDFSPSSSSNANTQSDLVSACISGAGKHHMAVDYEEMAEVRSIEEQHQMEWNDNMNLATSAWWFNFLKKMNIEPRVLETVHGGGYQPFDQAGELEFPAWLNSADNCSQQHSNDCSLSQDYFQDTALPGIEIGEFEAIDEAWLSG